MTELTEAQLDAAYSAMCEEIDRWEIVGPMAPQSTGEMRHGKPIMCEPYMARRLMSTSDIKIGEAENVSEPTPIFETFTDKHHAAARIQYAGLEAALKQFIKENGNAQVS